MSNSPSTNGFFWFQNLLFLPTALTGTVLSGMVLRALVVHRRKLLESLQDQMLALVVAVLFVYAVAISLQYLYMGFSPTALDIVTSYDQFQALLTHLTVVWLMASNTMLACVRYFAFKESKDLHTRRYLLAIAAVSMIPSILFVWATTKGQAFPAPDPSYSLQRQVWIGTLCVFGVVYAVTIFATYLHTYNLITKRLDEMWTSALDERPRLLLQRKTLRTCVAMGTCLFGCYVPAIVFVAADGEQLGAPAAAQAAVVELALLDLVITPVLMLYLVRKLRVLVFASVGLKDWVGAAEASEENAVQW
ncbi:hypothetical protein HDU83_008878 [Entophlyctis luteolus]|nr:hypothetical protein HDU83_008878 [Entophlyctis luteolus]KAJ3390460.1 hypothetical protein HDU84_007460 [Entophlyctis sp. JEL0112]